MTSTTSQSLDLDRLEKVRHLPGKIVFRCPGCAAEGGDRSGEHGALFLSTGKWSCVRDDDHTGAIFAAAGIREEIDPEERRRRWQEDQARRRRERERHRRQEAAKSALPELIQRWRWDPVEFWHDSPTHPADAADDPRLFIASLFDPEAIVWTGGVKQSGEMHADRWRSVSDWFNASTEEVGPMVTPSTWRPETVSRKRENIIEAPFIVLDFDGKPGWKPRDQADLDRHLDESLAITRWLKEDRRWNLAAIVHTGNKSLHCWFDHPGDVLVKSLRQSLETLGIDKSLIGHPEHPARLPGQAHAKSGIISRVLWLR
jgi:hypothetical protein